jgi:hypothetical protein
MSKVELAKIYNKKEYRYLIIILLITFIHGFLYVFIIPPWQHYDEPNHFEYAWLVANLNRLPELEDKDYQFNREAMESMVRSDFFRGVGYQPQLDDPNALIELFGHSQLSDPPFYYIIVSLPLRVFNYLPIEIQLSLVRLLSMSFLFLTILSAWGIATTLTEKGNPLRWMLPLTLALLPGLVELMTAVNNDAASIGFFSLFLWGSVRLIKIKIDVLNILWVLISAIFTYLSKNTAVFVLIILPFVFLFAFLRNHLRIIAWALISFGILFALLVGVRWGEAAYWYRSYVQPNPVSLRSESAVLGNRVFNIETINMNNRIALFQIIPEKRIKGLAGKEVTFGGWMWSSNPVTVTTPILIDPNNNTFQEITLDSQPKFFSFSTVIPKGSYRMRININPRLSDEIQPVSVYYDGLFLVEGAINKKTRIRYKDDSAKLIWWNDEIKKNIIRNGSGELSWIRLLPALDQLSTKFVFDLVISPTIISSIIDFSGSSPLYNITLQRLFRSFWAEFGWGHISLNPKSFYSLLLAITIIGIVGFILYFLRKYKYISWDVTFIFGLSLLLSWGMTIVRGIIHIDWQVPYIPVARYSYPVVIPTIIIIVCGWNEWRRLIVMKFSNYKLTWVNNKFISQGWIIYGIFFISLIVIMVVSFYSIVTYYQS